jgi:hypothetical protein
MSLLKLQPTVQAQWYDLVHEAHQAAHVSLSDELKSYLIGLLMRFVEQTDLAESVIVLDYLESQHSVGHIRRDQLRDVGDKCLLFSGLYPGRARRANVRVSHFVAIGQSAYGHLSEVSQAGLSILFRSLSCQFVPLMDVLQVLRQYSKETPILTPIEAYELWVDTKSVQAKRCLAQYSSENALVLPEDDIQH